MLLQSVGNELVAATSAIVGPLNLVIVGRVLLSLILCGAIGLERSSRDRASGFRTHILVGLAACLMTLAGGYGFSDVSAINRDPMRLASYIVSGIGFIGAGAILRHGTTVRGLTTAATLWSAAGIGIAVGVGLGGLAALTVILVLFTLVPLKKWEARRHLVTGGGDLDIHLRDDHKAVGTTLAALARLGVPVKHAVVLPGADTSALLRVELASALKPDQIPPLVRKLLTLKQVVRVDTDALLGWDAMPIYRRPDEDDAVQYDPPVGEASEEPSDEAGESTTSINEILEKK